MRKILFRGMGIDGAWHYGNLALIAKKVDHIEAGSYISNGAGVPFAYQCRPETIGQFTGLQDRHGKEIYEGDILKWKSTNPFSLNEIRTVSTTYSQAQFWCNGTGRTFGKFGIYLAELLSNERCEIIGNIHDNPNLLTP